MSTLHRITLLGSGVLGSQISFHSAYQGKTVTVYDVSATALAACRENHRAFVDTYQADIGATDADASAALARLTYTTDLAEAVGEADLVIEAVPEVPDIKRAVYTDMAPLLPDHTVLATNSSTFLPSDFAAETGRPDRFCALHFGNGIWTNNFAEIMAHAGTSRSTLQAITEFAIEIGMVPIPVRKEVNGYIVNAWFIALVNAAQTLVTNGIGTAEDIDRSYLKSGATRGPLSMIDRVGMQTSYDIFSYWGAKNGDQQMTANAEYLKENFLDKGHLGLASGQGYYTWPNPSCEEPGFLDVPDISAADDIVSLLVPH